MTVIRTFKYRLYPTAKQEAWLGGQLREACDLYNCAIQERRDAWKTCRKSVSLYDQIYQLRPMRAEGLIGIPNFGCAMDVLQRVDRTFRAFFARIKRGDKAGYPRFKSARRYDSIAFPAYGDGCKVVNGDRLRLQGCGQIKFKLHRPIEGKIKTVTIKSEAGRWFVCFCVEMEAEPLPISGAAVGVDVGLSAFATLSDGSEIENPRFYKEAQAKLRRAQRKVSRRKKGSNRRRKAVRDLQRIHVHIQNQRANFHHGVSRWIVNRYGTIAVEDLNVKGLARMRLAKSVHDAGWSQFLDFIAYKAEEAGRRFVRVDPRGTSQICICGAPVPKRLNDRWHECPVCGLSAGRDLVSAQVILQRAGNRPSGANVGEVMPRVA